MSLDRRTFLRSSAAAGGGLLLHGRWWLAQAAAEAPAVQLNAFLRISPDNWITTILSQAEMGQGVETTFSAILADELGADWARIRPEASPAAPDYQHPTYRWQFTGNAESIRAYHLHLRRMAAAAREMLLQAAAARWRVPAAHLVARDSFVEDPRRGARASFGELAGAAARLTPPQSPRIKPRAEWKLVGGKSLPRTDVPAKVFGTAEFGIDAELPGMVHAVLAVPPEIGGRVARYDRDAALRAPGVLAVVPLDDAIAVVAASHWEAVRGLAALAPAYTASPERAAIDQASLDRLYRRALAEGPFKAVIDEGDAPAALAAGGKLVEVEYRSAWQAHAAMEPMNCIASVTGDRCELVVPTQGQELTQIRVSEALGIPKQHVSVQRTYLGGGFGRRLLADFAVQAARIAKAVGRPVKLLWSREDDFRQDWFRPAVHQRGKVALGADGLPAAAHHVLVSPTILTAVSRRALPEGLDPSCLEGLAHHPYGLLAQRLDFHLLAVPIQTAVWRTTGYGPNVFYLEGLIDELAHAAGQRPEAYRRALIERKAAAAGGGAAKDRARLLAVMDHAVALGRLREALPKGRGRGLAIGHAFQTFFAQVIDVSLTAGGALTLHHVTTVVDAGCVLDPQIARANIEGGVVWGLTQALHSEISFAAGRVEQRNFDRFRLLSLAEAPSTTTEFIDGDDVLGGLGEVGPIPVAPALTNAIFAATGRRLRSLPLHHHGITVAPAARTP
jgi:isoquinoline 1-oxidoreductase beta subunit